MLAVTTWLCCFYSGVPCKISLARLLNTALGKPPVFLECLFPHIVGSAPQALEVQMALSRQGDSPISRGDNKSPSGTDRNRLFLRQQRYMHLEEIHGKQPAI